MLDNLSLKVEEIAQKEGSYIDAVVYLTQKLGYEDFEDILEVLHPLVYQKVKQEFIDKKYIPSMIQRNSLQSFFD